MRRAIVVGGSLAGMCAARVLREHFDEVTILERDVLPSDVDHRAGVPQSRHAHALLARGRQELERLFPGFSQAMRDAGAPLFDPGLHVATRRAPGWQAVGENGTGLLWGSRILLEHTVRRLLREQGGVRLLEGVQVLGLITRGKNDRRVCGVRMRDRDREVGELEADLVVDASGRNTRAESWLREQGIAPPLRETVDAGVGYASRLYRAPAQKPAHWWWKGLWVEWEPPTLPRAGVVLPIEGDRWFVSLAGIGDDRPPVDVEGFEAFMKTLSTPVLAQAASLATPISEVWGSRSLSNEFRRYDRWAEQLPGFLALGDSVCVFNPIYGQGMSSATACAALLQELLAQHDATEPGFPRRFFRAQAAFLKGVWTLATGADFRWPSTTGARPMQVPLLSDYLNLALQRLHFAPELRRQVNPVFNLTGPLSLFFAPRFVGAVLLSEARARVHAYRHGSEAVPELPPIPA